MSERVSGKSFNFERVAPIMKCYQQKGKIPEVISEEKLLHAINKHVLAHITFTDTANGTDYNLEQLISAGDRMLADTRSFREKSSEDFRKEILSTMSEARCFTISGPSGCGKAAINTALIEKGIPQVVLFNIRDDRGTEELYGVNYHFVREYPAINTLDENGEKDTGKEMQQKEKRAKILEGWKKKYQYISTASIHEMAGLSSQAVPHLLFDLGRKLQDPFNEVDIEHTKKIIKAAEKESARGNKINVFPVFILPPDFTTLMMQLVMRTLGEDCNNSHVSWYDAIFDEKMNVKNRNAADKFGLYIGRRLYDGIKNINDSQQVNPLYVVNNDLHIALEETLGSCKFRLPVDAAQAMQQDQAQRVSGLVTVNNYSELLKTQHRITSMGIPEMKLNLPQELASVYGDKIKEIKKEEKVQTVDYMDVNLTSISLVWADSSEYLEQSKKVKEQKPDIALFPGTFSPFHYGYLTSVMAAMKDFNLSGVIIMPGEAVGGKFELSFEHRYKMANIVAEKYSFIKVSPLRHEFSQALSGVKLGGANVEEEQRLRDLGAFSFLVSMNPQVNMHYLARVDKVNDFGPSRKNEKGLLHDLLMKNNKPLIWQAKRGVNFELFSIEWEKLFAKGGHKDEQKVKESWLLNSEEEIKAILREGTTPTFNVSTEEKRKKVANRYPLYDFMDPNIIDYIYRSRLNEAYELEIEYQDLVNEFALGMNEGITLDTVKDNFKVAFEQINQKKQKLFEEGVIADGSPIKMDTLLDEVTAALSGKEKESGEE